MDIEEEAPPHFILSNYCSIETVYACEMTLGEYLELRNWHAGEEDDVFSEGYLIEVPEIGPGHLSGFAGYVCWCPKGEFEQKYQKVPATTH